MNDDTLVDPSHISVNSTYQTYEDDDVNQIRPKKQRRRYFIYLLH